MMRDDCGHHLQKLGQCRNNVRRAQIQTTGPRMLEGLLYSRTSDIVCSSCWGWAIRNRWTDDEVWVTLLTKPGWLLCSECPRPSRRTACSWTSEGGLIICESQSDDVWNNLTLFMMSPTNKPKKHPKRWLYSCELRGIYNWKLIWNHLSGPN